MEGKETQNLIEVKDIVKGKHVLLSILLLSSYHTYDIDAWYGNTLLNICGKVEIRMEHYLLTEL